MKTPIPFNRVRISPLECLGESWRRTRDRYWLLLGITTVGILIGSFVPMGILLGPMMCGIYLCYLDLWRGLTVRFETLFKGFDHFAQSLIATLIMIAAGFVIAIPFTLAIVVFFVFAASIGASRDAPAVSAILVVLAYIGAFLLMMIISSLIGTFFVFTYPLIVERRLSGTEAVEMSVRAATANIWGLLGLMLVILGMSLCGACACYVGTFFVLPLSTGALMAAYDRVFGVNGLTVNAL
jgi:uncharacterized membrane protein